MEKKGKVQFAEHVRAQFGQRTGPIATVANAVSRSSDAFFWDCTIVGAACGRVAGSRCWGTPRRAFCRPRGLGPQWRCSRRGRWPTNFRARCGACRIRDASVRTTRSQEGRVGPREFPQVGKDDADRIDAARLGSGPVDAVLYSRSRAKGYRRDHGRVAGARDRFGPGNLPLPTRSGNSAAARASRSSAPGCRTQPFRSCCHA
jgi:hypothetical protein